MNPLEQPDIQLEGVCLLDPDGRGRWMAVVDDRVLVRAICHGHNRGRHEKHGCFDTGQPFVADLLRFGLAPAPVVEKIGERFG